MTDEAIGTLAATGDGGIDAALEVLESQADAVCTVTENFNAAVAAELDAEGRVLERALLAIAPLRRVLCGRIASEHISWVATGREHKATYFPQRGLMLSGGSRQAGGFNDTRGEYSGTSLVLWADGTLAVLEYSGEWTRWEREADRLQCTARPVSVHEALQLWDLEGCLTAITTALSNQAELAKPANAERARARAAKLAAVAILAG